MKCLLDAHVFLWSLEDDPKLSSYARGLLENSEHQPVLSVVGLWEMAIKIGIGKLEQKHAFEELVDEKVLEKGLELLHIAPEHLDILGSLPFHHRDPPVPCESG